MGDDARFEFIYKFVSRDRVRPGGYAANRDLLDHGTLYAARFDANGQGAWLELTNGDNGHADQAEVLVHARLAASARGATPMDRPEWVAIHPRTEEVFCQSDQQQPARSTGAPGGGRCQSARQQPGRPHHALDRGRRRRRRDHVQLEPLRSGRRPGHTGTDARYPSAQADAFGAPDGLYFDSAGLLWIQTDMSGQAIGKGAYANLGNNALLCADLATGSDQALPDRPQRAAKSPAAWSRPDRSTLFVNIQHPGETSDSGGARASSAWPDGSAAPGSARPRSAIVAVRRRDGNAVGT
jgi:secreted PhoX family phosphatase